MDYGHSHSRDVYWTKHSLHRIKQSGGTLEFMSETLAVSPQITLSKKALSKKHKYSKYRKDQQSFCGIGTLCIELCLPAKKKMEN